MSGWPMKYPGVWQSMQPPKLTRYLPRAICSSRGSAFTAGANTNAPASMEAAQRTANGTNLFMVVSSLFRPAVLRAGVDALVTRKRLSPKAELLQLGSADVQNG